MSSIQAHCNEAVIDLNFGTPKNNEFFHLEQMENLLFLGVPIFKHIRACFVLFFFFEKTGELSLLPLLIWSTVLRLVLR